MESPAMAEKRQSSAAAARTNFEGSIERNFIWERGGFLKVVHLVRDA
jgi:hypothetical protein